MDPQLRGVAELLKGSSLLRSQVGPSKLISWIRRCWGGGAHIVASAII